MLTRRHREGAEEEWVLSFQFPLPLREWEWHCTVRKSGRVLCEQGWQRVSLPAQQADRFFEQPGLWLQTEVASWAVAEVDPGGFDDVEVTVKLRGVDDERPVLLTAPGRLENGHGWYGERREDGPLQYPWFIFRFVSHDPGQTTALVRPQAAAPAGYRR